MRTTALMLAVFAAGCGSKQPPAAAAKSADPVKVPDVFRVKFETTKGPFVLEVVREWAPKGADRFHRLVRDGFYDAARFYRVRPGFVVQWGISSNPETNRLWKQLKLTDDPVKQHNDRGYIAYATDGPDTRTTEIFINLAENRRLDTRGFAPFGKVVEGMEAIDAFYSGYGEVAPRGAGVDPSRYEEQGDSYLQQSFPKLDQIKSARFVQ